MTHEHSPRTRTRVAVDAQALAALYDAPQILRVVNVWDAVSARVVAELPGTQAIATAGHGIAASHGYPDGEKIPLDLMLSALERIVQATDVPVSADLDGGFGNASETVRRAIGVGISGANIEDQMRPLSESVEVMRAALHAGEREGVSFVLNARTDALLKGGDRSREASIEDAVVRGRAYVEAGAHCVFVPGVVTADEARTDRSTPRKCYRASGRTHRRRIRGARHRAYLVRAYAAERSTHRAQTTWRVTLRRRWHSR